MYTLIILRLYDKSQMIMLHLPLEWERARVRDKKWLTQPKLVYFAKTDGCGSCTMAKTERAGVREARNDKD